MQTEKAIALRHLMIESFYLFESFEKTQNLNQFNINEIFDNESVFETRYDEFIEELNMNILNYQDFDLVFIYIMRELGIIEKQKIYFPATPKILDSNYETKKLLFIRFETRKYQQHIKDFFIEINNKNSYIQRYVRRTLIENNINSPYGSEDTLEFEIHYDFVEIMKTCNSYKKNYVAQIELINNRLYDFKQWKLSITNKSRDKSETVTNETIRVWYPDFEKQCEIEIERLTKLAELQNNKSILIETPPYKWNSTVSDFLELFAALYQNESIVRADGNALTRKEMLEYFQGVLGMEIKDTEGRLAKVGSRENNTAFLDKLAQQFRNYVSGKEKKLQSRK